MNTQKRNKHGKHEKDEQLEDKQRTPIINAKKPKIYKYNINYATLQHSWRNKSN